MEYEAERNRTWQVASLCLTIMLVGGAMLFAFSAG
jgi:hypothetical protein